MRMGKKALRPLSLAILMLLLALASNVHSFQLPVRPQQHRPPPPTTPRPAAAATTTMAASVVGLQQLQRWGLLALAVLAPAALAPAPSEAFDAKGAKLFEENCSSCHVGGSNVIGYARAKTLKAEALKKNKVDSKEAIVGLMEKGVGVMPKYVPPYICIIGLAIYILSVGPPQRQGAG